MTEESEKPAGKAGSGQEGWAQFMREIPRTAAILIVSAVVGSILFSVWAMEDPAFLILVFVIGLPILWFIAEFRGGRPLRLLLGVLAFASTAGVAALIGSCQGERHRLSYGYATETMIRTMVREIDDGHFDRVLNALRALDAKYESSKEERWDYGMLVADATASMQGERKTEEGGQDAELAADRSEWAGLWDNGEGYWFVVDNVGDTLSISPSGRIGGIVLSNACRALSFEEGPWRHKLELINRNQAAHEWIELQGERHWRNDRMFRAARTIPETTKGQNHAPLGKAR